MPFLIAAAIVSTGVAGAQTTEDMGGVHEQLYLDLSFGLMVPVGEFAESVDLGAGFGGGLVFYWRRLRAVGLRTGLTWLNYGHDSRDVLVDVPRIGIVELAVSTNNDIWTFQMGPQVTMPGERVRPYVFGTAGLSHFRTSSGTGETSGQDDIPEGDPFSETHLTDSSLSGTVGGGIWLRVRGGRSPVFVDVSGTYLANGRLRYLTKEGIQEAADGTLLLAPIHGRANLVLVRVGVSVGVG